MRDKKRDVGWNEMEFALADRDENGKVYGMTFFDEPYKKVYKWFVSLNSVSQVTLVPTCSLPNSFNKMHLPHSSRYAPTHATCLSSY